MLYNNYGAKREQEIQTFLKTFGLPDVNKSLIKISLMHPSYLNELNIDKERKDLHEKGYRRLCHLGDAMIGAIVTDYLFEEYLELGAGELTDVKQKLVNKVQLCQFATQLKIQQFCLLGKSFKKSSIDKNQRLFAEMFEAVIAAIYLGLKRDFSATKSWLIERFIMNAVKGILYDSLYDEADDYVFDSYEVFGNCRY